MMHNPPCPLCPKPNFAAVLSDIRDVQEERAEAYREALAEYKAADRALAAATLDTDMRRWTSDERDEYNSAMYRVEEAHAALEKAAAAL